MAMDAGWADSMSLERILEGRFSGCSAGNALNGDFGAFSPPDEIPHTRGFNTAPGRPADTRGAE